MIEVGPVQPLLDLHGLFVRGVLNFNGDGPALPDGRMASALLLIGCVGDAHWTSFSNAAAMLTQQSVHPLDDWSKQVIDPIASEFGGVACYPSDLPYQPFQQWAMAAEGLKPSPLGMLIHPVYGLWHSYRGAILFSDLTLSQDVEKLSHTCDTCIEKPCLSSCPVNAFSEVGYDVKSCRSHLATDAGQACMTGGCKARLACPVGQAYRYNLEQMQFHMAAFVK